MKRAVAVCLIVVLCCSLLACSSGLSGEYISESGKYQIKFEPDGSCTWYQSGMFFNGTYEKTEDGWMLEIMGGGRYSNTTFNVVKVESDMLIVNGGVVYDELFYKQ